MAKPPQHLGLEDTLAEVLHYLETFRGHLRVMEEKSLVKTDAEHEACHRARLKSMLATSARIAQEEHSKIMH